LTELKNIKLFPYRMIFFFLEEEDPGKKAKILIHQSTMP
jgi:hypothetical protein